MFGVEWAQAILYEPPIVLSRRLRPFSPFHALMLQSVDNPFFIGGDCGAPDLILAVHVCAHGWADRFAVMADAAKAQEWGQTCEGVDWRDEVAAFRLYMDESWKLPERWKGGGDDSEARANSAYHLAVFGMRHLGMSEDVAWDCPVARLVCYRECYAESETGKSRLVTEDERFAIDSLKAGENGAS